MKNGLLIYDSHSDHFNIGDYIQSLAARQFLVEPPILVNRENLNLYSGEDLKLIMNGWFLYELQNWPPSRQIDPLFVSFHLNSTAYSILERKEVVAYFKTHEPIGCRDIPTMEKFNEYGIQAYFSSCMTTTLGETYSSENKTGKIFIVDPYIKLSTSPAGLISTAVELLSSFQNISKINKKRGLTHTLRDLFITAQFYREYKRLLTADQLVNAEYTTHYLPDSKFLTEESRFEYAKELLAKYAGAALVVTSRIHCALPCLGLGTPAIYIKDVEDEEISTCRLDGLLQLLNVVNYDSGQFSSKDVNLNTNRLVDIKNKPAYVDYKNKLVAACKNFISKVD